MPHHFLATLATLLLVLLSSGCANASPSTPTWDSGLYPGADRSLGYATNWGEFRGSATTVVSVFPSRTTWEEIRESDSEIKKYDGFTGRLSVAVPLLPEDRSASLADVADGSHDADFEGLARTLLDRSHGDADVRIGWEFNGSAFPWSRASSPLYRDSFRRVANIFRSVSRQFTIDWNTDAFRNHGPEPVESSYPGDDVVDVIGVDVYDTQPGSPTTPEQFARWLDRPLGLNHWSEFARAHSKKLAVPEWGLDGTKHGGGDNPPFIQGMHRFFLSRGDTLAYESYFDAPDSRANSLYRPNQLPRSSQQYQKLWRDCSSPPSGENLGIECP